MSDAIAIHCGPTDSAGRRLVVATLGAVSHRHKFDTDSQFHRQQFREKLVDKFGLAEDAHSWIEQEILRSADVEDDRTETANSPVMVDMNDVQAEEVKWLWPARVAMGKLCIIAGDPGLGKSFLTIDIAARVSLGSKWFDCDEHSPLGSTIILNAEDALADVIKPRLIAAGADCTKVKALQAVRGHDESGEYQRPIDLQRDLATVEQAIASLSDCKLVIIDPISAYLGKTDSHKNSDVRAVLAPLCELAAKYSVAVLAVDHLTKSEAKAIYKVTGSIAFTGAARAVWAVTPDKHDSTGRRRLFLPIKSNLAEKKAGLAYILSPQHGAGGVPCVAWEPGEVSMSADEAMASDPRRHGPAPKERDEAADFLREALSNGPRKAKDVEEEARELHDIAPRTLKRARKAIGVEAFREKVPGPWLLRLENFKGANGFPGDKLHGSLGPLVSLSQESHEGQVLCRREVNGTVAGNGSEDLLKGF